MLCPFYFTKMITAFAATALFGFSVASFASPLSLENPALREDFLDAVREATIEDKPLSEILSAKYPGVNDKNVENGLFAFETSVLETYRISNGKPDLTTLAVKWGFSEDEAFDLSLYYTTRIFSENAAGESSNPRLMFDQLRELSRLDYIRRRQSEYDYLKKNVTRLSVVEMARELGIAQSAVYKRLGDFKISIVGEFNRAITPEQIQAIKELLGKSGYEFLASDLGSLGALAQLEAFDAQGLPTSLTKEISAIIGFGEQALAFVFHHRAVARRGQVWNRTALFDGENLTEVEILIRLKLDGQSNAQIADSLNRIFDTEMKDNLRTENAVFFKLSELGLSGDRLSHRDDLYNSKYGYLVKSNRLVVTSVFQFLTDHSGQTLSWYANELGVPYQTLHSFIARHHLQLDLTRETRGPTYLGSMDRYQRQAYVINNLLAWINDPLRGNGRTPHVLEASKILGFKSRNVLISDSGIFSSPNELYLELKKGGQSRGVNVSLVEIKLLDKSAELRQYQRADALKMMFEYFQRRGGATNGVKQYPIDYERLTGTGAYGKGQKNEANAFFNSSEEFWTEYKAYCFDHGAEFFILSANFKGTSEALRKVLQNETLELMSRWIVENNGEPFPVHSHSVVRAPIPTNARLVGTGNYGPGKPLFDNRIFSSRIELWKRLKQYMSERKLPLWLVNVLYLPVDNEIRAFLRVEALDLLQEWQNKHPGKPLTEQAFKKDPPRMLNVWSRLVGVREYAPSSDSHEYRIFDSVKDMILSLEQRMLEHADHDCAGDLAKRS